MNRRTFLAATAASASRVWGANGRLGVALIGSGRRGREVMKAFLDTGAADLRAVADVYDVQRDRARALLGKPDLECVAYQDVLARKDVDAVLIAAPDHLHLNIALDALRAGKHIYLEKPALHWPSEGETLRAAVRASGKVCQVGTQQRSGEHYRRAKEEIFAKGLLGTVTMVRANWSNFPWQARRIAPQPKPAGLDWDRFIGPAPARAYDWARYDSWRGYRDYGGGVLADILNHWADVAQWMMNDASPKSAHVAGGIFHLKDGRENPDTVSASIEYAGWNLSFESTVLPVSDDRPTVLFQGTQGTLDLARASYIFKPHQGTPVEVKAAGSLEIAHTRNFIDAIAAQRAPSTPIETGLDGLRPCFLARQAYWDRHS
jgi:predicted dehydrogenase